MLTRVALIVVLLAAGVDHLVYRKKVEAERAAETRPGGLDTPPSNKAPEVSKSWCEVAHAMTKSGTVGAKEGQIIIHFRSEPSGTVQKGFTLPDDLWICLQDQNSDEGFAYD